MSLTQKNQGLTHLFAHFVAQEKHQKEDHWSTEKNFITNPWTVQKAQSGDKQMQKEQCTWISEKTDNQKWNK